jgi:hypothetical protein
MKTNENNPFLKPMHLGEAIYSWLNYISYISDSNVLAESSIRYPLAEFIERRLHRPVTLEFYHPCVPQPERGHKKCIDFVFSKLENDNDIENTFENKIGEERVYIELKYINEDFQYSNEKQRVFNDLVRLALVSSETNDCYFILCGGNEDFCQFVKGSPEVKKGKVPTYNGMATPTKEIRSDYAQWLYLEKTGENEAIMTIDSNSVKSIKGTKNYREGFDNEYNHKKDKSNVKNPVEIPKTIYTKRVYISDNSGVSQKMMVAIWKVWWAKSEEENNDQKAT